VTRPIVFMTDYGLVDEFVGVCHGVIAGITPDALVIDLTHDVPRQDVMRGALTLSRATKYMPSDAVYLAVVDPRVGSDRRSIAVRAGNGALLVGPDNGLLSLAWQALFPVSRTFHGRDVFSPCAAHLARGTAVQDVGPTIEPNELHTLEIAGPMVADGAVGCRVVGVDGFGNVQLNARAADLDAAGLGQVLQVSGRQVPRVGIFGDVPEGMLAMIVDSQGYLALVVNHGNAGELLNLKEGTAVVLE
jgi:S-adenosyl-L-methionine hydrolase (adenosine-forming)